MATKLTAKKVEDLYVACLYGDNEVTQGTIPEDVIIVTGILNKTGFDPVRIKEHTDEIRELLLELPNEFMSSGGGGGSFLNACNDKYGNQWSGLHQIMELLFMLGIAISMVYEMFPRDVWHNLPGGVPYYIVKDVGTTDEAKPLTTNDLQGEAWLKLATGTELMTELEQAIQVVTGVSAQDVRSKICNFAVWNEIIYRIEIGRTLAP